MRIGASVPLLLCVICPVVFGDSITSVTPIAPLDYATAYSDGLVFFLGPGSPAVTHVGGVTSTTNAFSGVEIYSDGNPGPVVAEACSPGPYVGSNGPAGLAGCPASRSAVLPPTATGTYTQGTSTVSVAGTNPDGSKYTGYSTDNGAGVYGSGSLSVNRTSGSGTAFDTINSYETLNTAFTVAPDATHLTGSLGTANLTYTVSPPNLTGGVTGDGIALWYGVWSLLDWLPTGVAATDQTQFQYVDLTTLTGPTQLTYTIPIVFGSPTIVRVGQQVGLGWGANGGTGASSANLTYDPVQSLTGIQIFGANGAPLPNFSASDGIGTLFSANGAVAAPEPTSVLLMGGALGALLLGLKVRRA